MTLPTQLPFDLSFLYQLTQVELLFWSGTLLLVAVLLTWLVTFLWLRRRYRKALKAADHHWRERWERFRQELITRWIAEEEAHRREVEGILAAVEERFSEFRRRLADCLADQVASLNAAQEAVLDLAGERLGALNEAWCERLFDQERLRTEACAKLLTEQVAFFNRRLEALAEAAGIVRTTTETNSPEELAAEALKRAELLSEQQKLWEERFEALTALFQQQLERQRRKLATALAEMEREFSERLNQVGEVIELARKEEKEPKEAPSLLARLFGRRSVSPTS